MVDVPFLRCSYKRPSKYASKFGKRRYDSQAACLYANKDKPGGRAYWCPHCGGWHITRSTERERVSTRFCIFPNRTTLYGGLASKSLYTSGSAATERT